MDHSWGLRPAESRGRRHHQLGQDEISDPSMTGFLSGLKTNLHETLLPPECQEVKMNCSSFVGQQRQFAHDHWQTQLEQHQKQFQRHQRHWQLQQQDWLDQTETQQQQQWQGGMRRRSGRKAEKPQWTCLAKLQKTLTVDSAEEEEEVETTHTPSEGPPSRSRVQKYPEEIVDEYKHKWEQKHRRRRHHDAHTHGHRGQHRVRWSGIDPDFDGEDRVVDGREVSEEEQQVERYDHVSPVASPRFGRPESPQATERKIYRDRDDYGDIHNSHSESSPRRSPAFGSRRHFYKDSRKEMKEDRREGINYIEPSWAAAMHGSFPTSASTAATPLVSPGRRPAGREQQLYNRIQVAHGASLHEAEQEGWDDDEVENALPRRQRVLEGSYNSDEVKLERQGRLRGSLSHRHSLRHHEESMRHKNSLTDQDNLRRQLDEGLRKALTQDLLEFQKEAFFGKRKAKLQVLEEGVEWNEDQIKQDNDNDDETNENNQGGEADDDDSAEQAEKDTNEVSPEAEEKEKEFEAHMASETQEGEADKAEAETEETGNDNVVDVGDGETQQRQTQHDEATECHMTVREACADLETPEAQEETITVEAEEAPGEHSTPIAEAEELDHEESSPLTEICWVNEALTVQDETERLSETSEANEASAVQEETDQQQQGDQESSPEQDYIREEQSELWTDEAVESSGGASPADQLTCEALRALSLEMLHEHSPPSRNEGKENTEDSEDASLSGLPADLGGGFTSMFGGMIPAAAAALGAQHLQQRMGADMLYDWLASTARMQQQLLMQAAGGLERVTSSATSNSSSSSSSSVTSRNVSSDFQWWTGPTEILEQETKTPTNEEENTEQIEAEETFPSPEKPKSPEKEADSLNQDTDLTKVDAAAAETQVEEAAGGEVAPTPSPSPDPTEVSLKKAEAAENATAAANAAAAAATTAALEAARAASEATAALALYRIEAAEKEKQKEIEVTKMQGSNKGLPALSPRDLEQFQRLQKIRKERAAAAAAAAAAGGRTQSASSGESSFRESLSLLDGYQDDVSVESKLTPKQELPAPPKAREARGRAAQEHAKAEAAAAAAAICVGEQSHAESRSRQQQQELQTLQRLLQQQLVQQQRLQQEQQEQLQIKQLQLESLQQEQTRRKSIAESQARVRFSDEAIKNEELKEQLKAQSKELKKLRRFRDQQQVLHEETEQHIDTLHMELQKLAGENVSLLQEQKRLSLAAMTTAFKLLFVHALNGRKEKEKRDVAVSPRNEEAVALEDVIKQNRELEHMQWQLQRLRQKVAGSNSMQLQDQQQIRELTEIQAKLQQENLQLRDLLNQMQGKTDLAEKTQWQHTKAQWSPGLPDLEASSNSLASEQRATLEAEEQLRETLEVMQLLKQCLQEHKEKVAYLEQQLQLQQQQHLQLQQQQQQLLQQQQQQHEPTQATAILELLERETAAETEEISENKEIVTAATQREERGARKTLRHATTATNEVETTETGVQAGPPMPYGRRVGTDAEQQQQLQQLMQQGAQHQQLIAKLKAALATQAKAFSQDKAYYQQLVLQMQQRIVELERYQHQLLLHLQQQQQQQQQQQAMALHSGAMAATYQPPMYQALPPFEAAQAASAAAAAALLQMPTTVAAVQEAARDAAKRQQQQQQQKGGGSSGSSSSEDWLQLLADAIGNEEGKKAEGANSEENEKQLMISFGPGNADNDATNQTAAEKANEAAESTRADQDPASIADVASAAAAATGEHALVAGAVDRFKHPLQEQMQSQLFRQVQDILQGKMCQHLEKLQQTLESPTLQSPHLNMNSGRPLELPAPQQESSGHANVSTGADRARHNRGVRTAEDGASFAGGVGGRDEESRHPVSQALHHGFAQQQEKEQQEQQIMQQRLMMMLQSRPMYSALSSPSYVSPVGTVDSLPMAAGQLVMGAPLGMGFSIDLKGNRRHNGNKSSPITSTTASSVVADFSAEENNMGTAFVPLRSVLAAQEDEREGPGAREKIQELRRQLRQQGLLN